MSRAMISGRPEDLPGLSRHANVRLVFSGRQAEFGLMPMGRSTLWMLACSRERE